MAAIPAEAKPIFSAVLTGSDGEDVKLSRYRGKPMLLFYEDRHSTQMNKPLKDQLFQWGKEQGFLDAANVVAVANLKAFNFFPAKEFALQAVRGVEKKVGIPILVDLKGTMSSQPWGLPEDSSTVVLFDDGGTVVYQKTGKLNEAEIKGVFTVLEKLIKG